MIKFQINILLRRINVKQYISIKQKRRFRVFLTQLVDKIHKKTRYIRLHVDKAIKRRQYTEM